MKKSLLLKYVASPQNFAYMPPIYAAIAIGLGALLWFGGMIIGVGPIPGAVISMALCVWSVTQSFKDPHTSNIFLARQKWIRGTKSLTKTKGKTYVG